MTNPADMTRLLPVLCAAALAACNPNYPYPTETFTTPTGNTVTVAMIHHGSIALDYKGFHIQIDPVGRMGVQTIDYSCFPKADCILITHEHGDHLDAATIDALSKNGTRLLLNAASRDKIERGEAIANGETVQVGPVGITAVPAYNITEDHLKFHPKGNGNGYILDFDGLRIYVSGDTEDIDEMAGFAPVDVAFLSANQPYTMTASQCVDAAMALRPKVLIPYHLSNTDVREIKDVLDANDSGIQVLLFEELR